MNDFFEIDFLDVEAKKSGDAIPLRYSINGGARIHITDGGFQGTGGYASGWGSCRWPKESFWRVPDRGVMDVETMALLG